MIERRVIQSSRTTETSHVPNVSPSYKMQRSGLAVWTLPSAQTELLPAVPWPPQLNVDERLTEKATFGPWAKQILRKVLYRRVQKVNSLTLLDFGPLVPGPSAPGPRPRAQGLQPCRDDTIVHSTKSTTEQKYFL